MTTQSEQEEKKEFQISLPENDDKEAEFAFILTQRKPSLRNTFEKNFFVKFSKDTTGGHTDGQIFFTCSPENEEKVRDGYKKLLKNYIGGQHLTNEMVVAVAANIYLRRGNSNDNKKEFQSAATRKNKGPYKFTPRTEGQKSLYGIIDDKDVTFGIGPAGTGKTHVAVAKAVEALRSGRVEKILLARPAIGNGEKLGALPGGIEDKLAPFMRPLYDELNEVLTSSEELRDKIGSGVIEIVPVEMMRGRTFKNAFVIVDEAQNCTEEQMRMALTRLGDNSKMVVTGDPKQVDLKPKELSGLQWALDKLSGVEGIGVQYFSAKDVVRHPVVARIVTALDADTEVNQPVSKQKPPAGPN